MSVGDLVRPLDLQGVMIDDADDDLLVLDRLADRLQIAGTRGAGLEGQRVGVNLVEGVQRRLIALHVAEYALLRRVAPAGMAPHLGLRPQSFHGVVEDFHEIIRIELAESLAARRHHVDLRFLHLDHRAAGVGEIIELLVERFAQRPGALDRILVMVVLHRGREQLRQDGAELDRLPGHALRRLPHGGVLQSSTPYRSNDPRKHTGFQKIVQNMTARKGDGPDLVGGGRRHLGKAIHMGERVALPAHAGDLLVIVGIPVGADIQAGDFLRPQEAGDCVLVLLAEARIGHCFEKALRTQSALYQDGRGNDPMIEVGSTRSADALYILMP